jgi:N-acetylmuramoyl-L-alanine amidase
MPIADPAPLLRALVRLYRREPVRHPALQAAALAHWLHESSDATSLPAQQLYNFAHLPWRQEMAGVAQAATLVLQGRRVELCRFATIESFVDGYWVFINRAPYSGWEETAGSAEDFLRFIAPRWAPGRTGLADRLIARLPDARALLDDDRVAPPPAARPSIGTVVIDPGHGGTSNLPGSSANNAVSVSGVKEKKLTLDLALMLQAHLARRSAARGVSVRVLLTRDGDVNVPGAERAGLAAREDAQAFLSLHFNGLNGRTRGTETFFAAAENGNLNLEADTAFARRIQAATLAALRAGGLAPVDRGVKPDTQTGVRRLAVLSDRALVAPGDASPVAACLLETEFIDHPLVDRAWVSGPAALALRGRVAEALADALLDQLGAPAGG